MPNHAGRPRRRPDSSMSEPQTDTASDTSQTWISGPGPQTSATVVERALFAPLRGSHVRRLLAAVVPPAVLLLELIRDSLLCTDDCLVPAALFGLFPVAFRVTRPHPPVCGGSGSCGGGGGSGVSPPPPRSGRPSKVLDHHVGDPCVSVASFLRAFWGPRRQAPRPAPRLTAANRRPPRRRHGA